MHYFRDGYTPVGQRSYLSSLPLRRKAGSIVREYVEIVCESATEVLGEISLKADENFEFVSVIVKRPATFLLRMSRVALTNQSDPI